MKYNPLDGDRAAIVLNNQIERNASEKRWDAFYMGCRDARNGKKFNNIYVDIDERKMYNIGWNEIKGKFHTSAEQNTIKKKASKQDLST